MTVPEKVIDFLTVNKGKSFCDDCIARECGIKNRRQIQPITANLAFVQGFKRYEGSCNKCTAKIKLVVCAV